MEGDAITTKGWVDDDNTTGGWLASFGQEFYTKFKSVKKLIQVKFKIKRL